MRKDNLSLRAIAVWRRSLVPAIQKSSKLGLTNLNFEIDSRMGQMEDSAVLWVLPLQRIVGYRLLLF